MIAIVHYGLGNVHAFATIYKRLGIPAKVAESRDDLAGAERIILPGVGAFDWALELLDRSGMRPDLERMALQEKRPVLGVCVGMQMLADRSEEGRRCGLGWIPGEVRRFDEASFRQKTRLPHMGWNDAAPRDGEVLFRGLDRDARCSFLHSYYFKPSSGDHVMAVTDYNGAYASGVRAGNVYGVQFHPEKSHQWGVRLLQNFAEL